MTIDGISELEHLAEVVLKWCEEGSISGVPAMTFRDIARLAKLAQEASVELRELYDGDAL